MRLVISYTEGDGCTYSCDRDVPVEYESAEKLLCDIEFAALDFIENYKIRRSEYAKIDSLPLNKQARQAYWEAHERLREKWDKYDKEDAPSVQLAKKAIYINHFIDNEQFYAPTIYTLDEWFDAKVEENATAFF